jgi:hypothetical protein
MSHCLVNRLTTELAAKTKGNLAEIRFRNWAYC